MNRFDYYVGILITLIVVLTVVTFFVDDSSNTPSFTAGGVDTGQEYNATSTVDMTARFGVLKTSTGALGSVIVASSSATTFKVWNATSTTDVASTTPVQFVASPDNGTYIFDAVFDRGIIVETISGFDGSYTITWR